MAICSLCQPALSVPTPLPSLTDTSQYRHNLLGTERSVPYIWNSQDKTGLQDSVGLPHYSSLDSLTSSAQECPFCVTILQNVRTLISDFQKIEQDAASRYDIIERQGHGLPVEWSFKLAQRLDGEEGFSVFVVSNEKWRLYMVSAFGFCGESGTLAAEVIRGIRVETDASSTIPLNLARHWISDCITNHGCCKPSEGPLPSRLLDLSTSNDGNIRLSETKDAPPSPYVALSHCWGKDSSGRVTTTHETLSDHLHSIVIERLPKTFRDAIKVTQNLGIRFLWIDSLCICQDDVDEWARESAAMTNVYAGAYLVIAADCSPGSTHGFFQRTERIHIPVVLTVALENSEPVSEIPALAFELNPSRVLINRRWLEFEGEPLASRAWGLQERLLPQRLLHFGKEQLFFECNNHFLSEDGIKIGGRWNSLYPGQEQGFHNLARKSRVSHVHNLWYLILEEFTSRKLTVESDRLPSIAGLAKAIKQRLDAIRKKNSSQAGVSNVKYVAGLWSDSLVEGLGWSDLGRNDGRLTTFPDESPLTGEKGYIAPTWSWASYPGISCHGNTLDSWTDVAVVVDWWVLPKDEHSPYGEVVGGEIRIRAPMLRLTLSEVSNEEGKTIPNGARQNMVLRTPRGDICETISVLDGIQGQTEETKAWARDKELFALFLSQKEEKIATGKIWSLYKALIIAPIVPRNRESVSGEKFRRFGVILLDTDLLGEDGQVIADLDGFSEIVLV